MKTITICGSLRCQEKMIEVAEQLALQGLCVLTPIYPSNAKTKRTKNQMAYLRAAHFQKIELSDAIFVINVGDFIGENTKEEIAYAKILNKEIIYLNEPNNSESK